MGIPVMSELWPSSWPWLVSFTPDLDCADFRRDSRVFSPTSPFAAETPEVRQISTTDPHSQGCKYLQLCIWFGWIKSGREAALQNWVSFLCKFRCQGVKLSAPRSVKLGLCCTCNPSFIVSLVLVTHVYYHLFKIFFFTLLYFLFPLSSLSFY